MMLRQFVTVKNVSEKATAVLVFQQTIGIGPRTEIVSMERVSIVLRPGEKKRLSVSVEDVWDRIQTLRSLVAKVGNPVLSVVVVEFAGGFVWSAPLDRMQ